jgi:hypothetical protein
MCLAAEATGRPRGAGFIREDARSRRLPASAVSVCGSVSIRCSPRPSAQRSLCGFLSGLRPRWIASTRAPRRRASPRPATGLPERARRKRGPRYLPRARRAPGGRLDLHRFGALRGIARRRISIDNEHPSSRPPHTPNGWPCRRRRRRPRLRQLTPARRPHRQRSRRKGACSRRELANQHKGGEASDGAHIQTNWRPSAER